jgi:hypothetical protein
MQLSFYVRKNWMAIQESNRDMYALLETTPHVSSFMTEHEGHTEESRLLKFMFPYWMLHYSFVHYTIILCKLLTNKHIS